MSLRVDSSQTRDPVISEAISSHSVSSGQGIAQNSSSLSSVQTPSDAENSSCFLCKCFDIFVKSMCDIIKSIFGIYPDSISSADPLTNNTASSSDRGSLERREWLMQKIDSIFTRHLDITDIPFPMQVVTCIRVNNEPVKINLAPLDSFDSKQAFKTELVNWISPSLQSLNLNGNIKLSVDTHFFHRWSNDNQAPFRYRLFKERTEFEPGNNSFESGLHSLSLDELRGLIDRLSENEPGLVRDLTAFLLPEND